MMVSFCPGAAMLFARRRPAAAATIAALLALACAGCSSGSGPASGSSRTAAPPGPAVSRAGAGTAAPAAGVPSGLLTPAQLRTAYDLWPLYARGVDGSGQTIVIVVPFGSPVIQQDLQHFDKSFGLPAPPSFRVITPAGPVPPGSGQERDTSVIEATLDVDWSHAIAPAASIVLVETPTAEIEGATGFAQIVQAEQYVLRHHLGGVISMSLGATEQTFTSKAQLRGFRSALELAAQPGYRVTLLASTGDYGATSFTYDTKALYNHDVVGWPASDPLVTAVGGTQLFLTRSGSRIRPDAGWMGSGGGQSAVFAKPGYQEGAVSGPMRGIPDISMDASCQSAVALYVGGASGEWGPECGTSLSSPLFAGIVALADQEAGHPLGLINPALYKMAAAHDRGIVDVVSGRNGGTFNVGSRQYTVPGFAAGPGYDLVTGLGTVDARYFVPELAKVAG
jgi:subtilase family serine protease